MNSSGAHLLLALHLRAVSRLLQGELAHSASQDHLNRPWHQQITIAIERTLRQTRRGRAPIAVQVRTVATRLGKARTKTKTAAMKAQQAS
jgi:hypothetical protein